MSKNGNGSTVATLCERAMVVDLTIRKFGTTLADEVVTQNAHATFSMQGHAGRYMKNLFPQRPPELKRIGSAITLLSNTHRNLTLPWHDGGGRIMTRQAFEVYGARMRALVREFDEAADAFAVEYPRLVTEAQSHLRSRFDPAEYPAADYVRGRYSVSSVFQPVSSASDFRVGFDSQTMAKLEAQYEQYLEERVEAAKADVFTRIRDTLNEYARRVYRMHVARQEFDAAGGEGKRPTLRDSTAAMLRELVDVLPLLNLDGNGRIAELEHDIRNQLGQFTAADLRDDPTVRELAVQQAEAIVDKMKAFM